MENQPKVMVSIGEIAERDGISKQAVSKVLRQLVDEHDIPVERDGRGRIKVVSLAHWDHHRGQFTNPAKTKPAGRTDAGGAVTAKDSFEEARRQNEWLKVERQKIDQAEAAGKLVRADLLGEALDRIAVEIRARIDRLQNKADDLAQAAMQEGVHGLRLKLREISFEMCTDIANTLERVARDAPRQDPTTGEPAETMDA